jgi:hypothetical protein
VRCAPWEAEQEGRYHQCGHDRLQGEKAADHSHHCDGEAPDHQDQPCEGVPDDLDLAGQPGYGPGVPPARDTVAQGAVHDPSNQLVAERLDQLPEPPVHLARADGPQAGDCDEPAQPGQTGSGAAGEEPVSGVRHSQSVDSGGQDFRHGPRREQ